jgi:uncharacterized protein YdcH (DUF465 family)
MKNEIHILNLVVTEFPQKKKEITALYFQSTSFLEICEDYVMCKNSIKKIEANGKSANDKNLNDLKIAFSDLKEELLSRIKNEL